MSGLKLYSVVSFRIVQASPNPYAADERVETFTTETGIGHLQFP
jgi:hypothetical protein